jgi:hypothetical protein
MNFSEKSGLLVIKLTSVRVKDYYLMTPSFVSAPPSAEADATRTNEFGANSKSSLKRTRQFGSSLKRT